MIEDALADLSATMTKAHEALKRELAKLRTGRANASLLDSIRVDYYGSPTPLQQMANISVPEARLLVVKPWDKSQLKAVEKAIRESDLGLNPQNDGEILRIPMPALTEERRRDLVKLARKYAEESKVAIRKARHEAKDMIDAVENDGDASADDCDRGRKKLEELVQAGTAKVDEIVTRKETDIMEV